MSANWHNLESMSRSTKYSLSLIIVLSLYVLSVKPALSQTPVDSVASLLSKAYALIPTDPQGAVAILERAKSIDPRNVSVRRQLAYLYEADGDHAKALGEFTDAQSLQPSDTVKLQIGYILLGMKRTEEANDVFEALASSSSAEIRQKAAAAYVPSGVGTFSEPRWWTHIYGVSYYDTRWNSWFYNAFVQEGYYLTGDKKLSAFGIAYVSGDNRSGGGGAVPQIFSDNAVIAALGVRYQPFRGLSLDVQQGIAYELLGDAPSARTRGDFRAVAVYGNGVYAPFRLHDSLALPFIPFVDLYSSFGYYSRYDNGIGYLQLRGGVRAVEVSRTVADLYARLDLVRDTEKEFFNNLVEIGGGMRLTPNVDWGLHFACEYHRGMYWVVSDREIPYDLSYNSVRLMVIFERTF